MTLAQAAAMRWGGTIERLISHRENAVYEMHFSNGKKAALRQHRPGYQSADSIRDEMEWTAALAAQGFPCPRPLAAKDGGFLVVEDNVTFSAVSWVNARSLADQSMTDSARLATFHALGGLLARLHGFASGMGDIGKARPIWSIDGLTGPDPLWGRFWETPQVGDPRREILSAAKQAARVWLQGQDDLGQCLIHADALGENVLGTVDDLWLIDFDDSGHGFCLYDLGVTLSQHWDQQYLRDIAAALLDGYGGTASLDHVLKFMALRCFVSAGWVQGRMQKGSPQAEKYIDRAVACAKKYLAV